jgi:protein tyrosine phosphatase (PTP) superfamily phosphohydrolase (DUF442 family)
MIDTPADTLSQLGESAPAKRLRRGWLVALMLLVPALPFLPEWIRVTLGPNFHTVLDGRLYRAAQPSAANLEQYVHRYGIRTVINLRGPNSGEEWFDEEEETARRLGVHLVSLNMSATDKPQEVEVRKLIDTFDQCDEPILVHCNGGSDRSGFAAACFLLMKTSAAPEEARAQLSLRYGHFSWGPAACQGQVLDQYQQWLASQNLPHSPNRFRRWAREVYVKDDWPEK